MSNVTEGAEAFGIKRSRLPRIWPPVREMVAAKTRETLFAPVIITPPESVRERDAATGKLLFRDNEAELPIAQLIFVLVSAPPLKVNVLLDPVKVMVTGLLVPVHFTVPPV